MLKHSDVMSGVAKSLQEGIVKKKQLAVALLKYGLGLGLLAWVVWKYWDGLKEAWQHDIQLEPFLLATGAFLIGLLITYYRWYVLVRAQDLPFTLTGALRLGLLASYLSAFLPGSVGGDIIKAAFIAREQRRRTVAVATVMVDRVIGLCALIWLVALIGAAVWLGGFLGELAQPGPAVDRLQLIILVALAITFVSFSTWFVAGFVQDQGAVRFAKTLERVPKVGHSLAELWRALHMYRRRGKVVAATMLMSLAGHVCFVLTFYFSSLTISPPGNIPKLGAHFLIVPVGEAFAGAFPAPGGVGGAEFAFGELYRTIGFGAAEGVLMALVYRVITWVLGLIGAIVYLRMKPSLQPLASAPPAQEAPVADWDIEDERIKPAQRTP
jgi:uncharacterized protein (TIRG00374 family)